jgi:hypothetical protein
MKKELGGSGGRGAFSWNRNDRLAAFLTNSNRIKGMISGQKTPGLGDFNSLQAGDEQLTFMRSFGFIFAYWNHEDIWGSWCATFQGIHTILTRFDADYNLAHPNAPANLATKWADFNRKELNGIAEIGRSYVDSLYSARKPAGGIFYRTFWYTRWWTTLYAPLINQKSYISFDKTCPGLPR